MNNSYPRQVEALLGEIERRVQQLRRLKAFGVRGPALAEGKRELALVRRQLADLVDRRWQLAPNR